MLGSCAWVCHLLRVLYSLQLSPWEWYLTLVDYLKSLGYEDLEHDHCVFIHQKDMRIAISMDGFPLLGPDLAKIRQPQKRLSDKFLMRNRKAISWYLGIEITRDRANRTLFIDQTAFIDRMFDDLRMEKCKLAKLPTDTGTEMVKNRYMNEDYKATKKRSRGISHLLAPYYCWPV